MCLLMSASAVHDCDSLQLQRLRDAEHGPDSCNKSLIVTTPGLQALNNSAKPHLLTDRLVCLTCDGGGGACVAGGSLQT